MDLINYKVSPGIITGAFFMLELGYLNYMRSIFLHNNFDFI